MKSVLVDMSVWVDHFRQGNGALIELLLRDRVLIHPMVLGELVCGTPPARARTLGDLALLQSSQQASPQEVIDFVEREKLYGLGCGLVDMTVLASTLLSPGVELWTLDKRLATAAQRFGVCHQPAVH